jgi:hypothetical protein
MATNNEKLSDLVNTIGNEMNGKSSVSINDIADVQDSVSSTINTGSSSSTSSFNLWFTNNMTSIILGTILILILLGINIFYFASEGGSGIIDKAISYVKNTFSVSGITLSDTTKNLINTTTTGTKGSVDTASKSLTDSAEGTKKIVQSSVNNKRVSAKKTEVKADTSSSNTQSQTNVKGGWCYIGEDKSIRTCANVNDTGLCMSGSIFDSEESCENIGVRT